MINNSPIKEYYSYNHYEATEEQKAIRPPFYRSYWLRNDSTVTVLPRAIGVYQYCCGIFTFFCKATVSMTLLVITAVPDDVVTVLLRVTNI